LWGCGKHVEQVMDGIQDTERCTCTPKVERSGKMYPSMTQKTNWLPGWATGVAESLGLM
jgi:hypothetical protein